MLSTAAVFDIAFARVVLGTLSGWLSHRQQEVTCHRRAPSRGRALKAALAGGAGAAASIRHGIACVRASRFHWTRAAHRAVMCPRACARVKELE